jgi:hypothetical protein
MSNSIRRLTALTVGCMAGGLLLVSPAIGQAATVFGSPLKNQPSEVKCQEHGSCTIVAFTEPSGPEGNPNSEGAPFEGVITKFRYFAYASEEPGQITFRVANINQLEPDNALATAAGTGPTVTVQPITEEEEEHGVEPAINEVAARLPVKKGQQLAVDITKSIAIIYNPDGCKFSYVFAPPLMEGGGQRGSTEPACQLLVQATLEPDADHDGFGDETQDQCPTQATTQGPCDTTPPGVTGLKVSNGKKVSYNLSEAATASFKVEKKSKGRKVGKKCVKQTKQNKTKKSCPLYKQVASFSGPGNVGANQASIPKKLGPGTYRLTMTARDAVGNVTTQTTTFKVAGKKKKKK